MNGVVWEGRPSRGLPLLREDRWLVPVGLVWTFASLGAAAMMAFAGAPAATWGGALVFASYGVWLAGLRLLVEERRLRGASYSIDRDTLSITGGETDVRVPLDGILAVRADAHRDGTATVWIAREGRWEPALRRVSDVTGATAALTARGAALL